MPKFKYAAVAAEGQQVRGVVDGFSVAGVTSILFDRGLQVTEVKRRKSLSEINLTPRKVKRPALMNFSRQLAAFLRAGVPILDALDIVQEDIGDKTLRQVVGTIADDLRGGENFAEAAAAHNEAFPPFYVGVLRSAEMTGQLDEVLDQLSLYIERDLESKRKVKSALAYPLIVMVLSVVTVAILAGFVLPRFEVFFESLDAELPLPTRMLLAATGFLTDWWFLIVGGFLAVVVGLVVGLQTRPGRKLWHALLLKAPALGPVVKYAVVERFCRLLAAMVKAGVPLPEAIAIASEGAHNLVYQDGLEVAREAMIRGEGVAGPIAQTELFPRAATQMMRVGEDTGTLDEQLEVTARYYEKELEYKLKTLTTLFEPMAIIFMGVVVGFVAIALISAMYGIFNQVEIA